MKKIAIILVCYNRINGLRRLCKSLLEANYYNQSDVTLIFSIDNSGSTLIYDFAKDFKWPFGEKLIRHFDERQGLKKHVLQCGDYTEIFDAVIVLEDDIIVSNSFFSYASQAIDYYWDNDNIAGISLYAFQKNWLKWHLRFEPYKNQYDTFFMKIAQSWGQVWTKKAWSSFRLWLRENPEIFYSDKVPDYVKSWPDSSWLKFHDKYCMLTNRYFVYPYVSLSSNCSDAGTHVTHNVNDHQVELQFDKRYFNFPDFNKDSVIYDEYMNRQYLGKFLGISDKELTIDFYQTKKIDSTRYILSTRQLQYRIIKSFQLSLRPIEASIIMDIFGEGIYLYDTSVNDKNQFKGSRRTLDLYSLRTHNCLFLLKNGIYLLFSENISRIITKITKWLS